jgi:hypothetical protein
MSDDEKSDDEQPDTTYVPGLSELEAAGEETLDRAEDVAREGADAILPGPSIAGSNNDEDDEDDED